MQDGTLLWQKHVRLYMRVYGTMVQWLPRKRRNKCDAAAKRLRATRSADRLDPSDQVLQQYRIAVLHYRIAVLHYRMLGDRNNFDVGLHAPQYKVNTAGNHQEHNHNSKDYYSNTQICATAIEII